MKLTSKQINNAKPDTKAYKLWDGYHGLHLVVYPTGRKVWKVKYRFEGKEREYTVGSLDTTTLATARKSALEAKAKREQGVNPAAEKSHQKREQRIKHDTGAKTIKQVCDLWWVEHERTLSSATVDKKGYVMRHYVLPQVGHLTFDELTPQRLLPILTAIATHSANTGVTASTVLKQSAQFAVLRGWASQNPMLHLKGAIPAPDKNSNYPAITEPRKVGGLMRALVGLREDNLIVGTALEVLARTAQRPGAVREMRWKDVDLDLAEWHSFQSKVGRGLVVPLSPQVVELLRVLHPMLGHGEFVFPGRVPVRCLSDNTFNVALRRAGIAKEEHVAHGFRHMFSTLCHSHGHEPHIIESTLGHRHGSSVSQVYNKAEYLPQRRKLLEWYSDYLDELRTGGASI